MIYLLSPSHPCLKVAEGSCLEHIRIKDLKIKKIKKKVAEGRAAIKTCFFNFLFLQLQAGHAALNFDKANDILTGLKTENLLGRPKWDNEFSTIVTTPSKCILL